MQRYPLISTRTTTQSLMGMQPRGPRPPQIERLFQSILAVLVMAVALSMLKSLNLVIIASLAGTACNLFALPRAKTSRPRNVIFGYTLGILIGLIGGMAVEYVGTVAACALATGLGIFAMSETDTLHPPAVATVLGIAIASNPLPSAISLIFSVAPLVVVHHLFKSRMRDVL